jgi:hypothetical protein
VSIADYKQLDVWSKAMDLAVVVYDAAKTMPKQ